MNLTELVVIDGPAGSGKGTLAERLARSLEFHYIDSGLMYRVVASKVSPGGMNYVEAAESLVADDLKRDDLRSEAISALTPLASKIPEVREAINRFIQKLIDDSPGSVLDGRAGAQEFSEARVKIFLAANIEVRTQRRFTQLVERGERVTLRQVRAELEIRDKRDQERETAPLKIAPDAFIIHSDVLSADHVFDHAFRHCRRRLQLQKAS